MSDWSADLETALADGDPACMQATLARVPEDVLHRSVPYLVVMARNAAQEGNLEEASTYYDQLLKLEPDNAEWRAARARVYLRLDLCPEALADATRLVELDPQEALGYRLQAQAHEGLRNRSQALECHRSVLRIDADDEEAKARIAFLESELRQAELLARTLDPESSAADDAAKPMPRPQFTFDPALRENPALPDDASPPMVQGLKQLLWRYSSHQSSRNTLERLQDAVWLDAWDQALRETTGTTVLFRGSELGTFALQALRHGATRALIVEQYPLDARISSGVVHKNLLTQWHALHAGSIESWSEDERRESFESFSRHVDIVPREHEEMAQHACDCLVYPDIDHSLLGTGIVQAIREHRAKGLAGNARILPARARVFAIAIQWAYPASTHDLRPVNRFRWDFSPQAFDMPADAWTALTEPVLLGEIDFERFAEQAWSAELPVIASGKVDAIVFWFDLQLGPVWISNAPDSGLKCIRPAVQHADSLAVEQHQALPLTVRVSETRLHFQTQPAIGELRSHKLPSWYVPMLLDRTRNDAYRTALEAALDTAEPQTVLDIGAGCGLLSMMAARAGASRVIACEVSTPIFEAGRDVIALNGLEERVALVNKDCRELKLPDDGFERADLAVFELFDCSLIGEGILHFLPHAREHLLKEGARCLPKAAKIRAMLIEYRLDRIWDFDVNLLNPYRFSPAFMNVDANELNYRPLSEPIDLFEFDFARATPEPGEKELRIGPMAGGTVGAVLFWFDLQLDEDLWISNAPGARPSTHWKQGLQFLPELRIEPQTHLTLIAKHDGSGLRLQWKSDVLQAHALSKIPRFDPRAYAAVAELEQQTRGLLQHCARNPDEQAKVVELAQRFAIDPAAHGIDPAMARRFAATFFGA